MKRLEFLAKPEALDDVLDCINEILEENDCPMKTAVSIAIAVEEIFVNIAHYAYHPHVGSAVLEVAISEPPRSIEICFIDRGKPFDPLSLPDPDITASAEEREMGGLGIYMVKKSMDFIGYEYKNGKNILTIRKSIA